LNSRKRRGLFLGISVLLAGLLAYFTQDYIRQIVLIPSEYVLWAFKIIFETIPQVVLWAILLIILLAIILKSISFNFFNTPKHQHPDFYRLPGRVETWSNRIIEGSSSTHAKWTLAHHLAELATEIISEKEHLSPKMVRESIMNGKLDVPPEIQAFFVAGMKPESPQLSTGFLAFRRQRANAYALDLDPKIIIDFLERGYTLYDSYTPKSETGS
jgi:hypothetical protein